MDSKKRKQTEPDELSGGLDAKDVTCVLMWFNNSKQAKAEKLADITLEIEAVRNNSTWRGIVKKGAATVHSSLGAHATKNDAKAHACHEYFRQIGVDVFGPILTSPEPPRVRVSSASKTPLAALHEFAAKRRLSFTIVSLPPITTPKKTCDID
eukprot:c23265_g1_i1.p1 GENE.c23265_g1_i1~~c23265_g1_i1.p1  ORF type:complete len:153 (-),score=36.64 c23265_g1_i1:191-649(-)